MTADRPRFFSHCPICNAETPQGAIQCPNCGVDLEIARANAIKDVAFAAGAYGYSVAQQNNPSKLLNDFWYVVIGIVANVVLSILVWVIINLDLNSGFWFSLACAFFILYFATWGRYGKVNFYGFINLLVWSAIPLINLMVFYYLGKGLHISFAKLELPQPPVATSAGTIIIVVLIVIGVVSSMAGNVNNPLAPPSEPTRPRPTITAKPAQLTLEAYYTTETTYSTFLLALVSSDDLNGGNYNLCTRHDQRLSRKLGQLPLRLLLRHGRTILLRQQLPMELIRHRRQVYLCNG